MSAAEELHGFPDEETLRVTRVEQAMKFLNLVIEKSNQEIVNKAEAWSEMVGDHVTPEGLKVIKGLSYLGSDGVPQYQKASNIHIEVAAYERLENCTD